MTFSAKGTLIFGEIGLFYMQIASYVFTIRQYVTILSISCPTILISLHGKPSKSCIYEMHVARNKENIQLQKY